MVEFPIKSIIFNWLNMSNGRLLSTPGCIRILDKEILSSEKNTCPSFKIKIKTNLNCLFFKTKNKIGIVLFPGYRAIYHLL